MDRRSPDRPLVGALAGNISTASAAATDACPSGPRIVRRYGRGVRHRAGRLCASVGFSVMAMAVPAPQADAQDRITLAADLLFYGDNTEFRNPFREGETIFGAAGSASRSTSIGCTVSLGVFGNQRFGSTTRSSWSVPWSRLTVRGRHRRSSSGRSLPGSPDGPAGRGRGACTACCRRSSARR